MGTRMIKISAPTRDPLDNVCSVCTGRRRPRAEGNLRVWSAPYFPSSLTVLTVLTVLMGKKNFSRSCLSKSARPFGD